MVLPKSIFSLKQHIGIALADASVRVVQVDGNKNILKQFEQTFPEPILSSHTIKAGLIVPALKSILAQIKLEQPYAAVSFPEKYAFSREHQMPLVNASEIDEAIGWQLEKIFPFPKEELYFDWKKIGQDDRSINLLITAINRRILDSLQVSCTTAGIIPLSFEPSASVLSRALDPNKIQATIILEIEPQGTMATLVVDGISTLTTTTIINNHMAPQAVFAEIINSVNHLRARIPSEKLPQLSIQMTGEKASPQLAQTVQSQLQLPTNIFDLPVSKPSFHGAYATAISAVLSPSSDKSINLLPHELHQEYKAQERYQIIKSSFIYATLGSLISIAIGLIGLGMLIASNATLNKEVAAIPVSATNNSGFDVNSIYPKAQRYLEVYQRKITPEYQISLIYDNLPQGITVSQVTYNSKGNVFSLNGTAQSRESMLMLKDNLDATEEFVPITLPLNVLENAHNFSFTLSFKQAPKTL